MKANVGKCKREIVPVCCLTAPLLCVTETVDVDMDVVVINHREILNTTRNEFCLSDLRGKGSAAAIVSRIHLMGHDGGCS